MSYGNDVERAYWWTEILDAYCRMLLLAKQLGRVNYFTEDKERELLDLKTEVGLVGPAEHGGIQELRHLRQRHLPRQLEEHGRRAQGVSAPPPMGPSGAAKAGGAMARRRMDQEALVQMITERVMAELAKVADESVHGVPCAAW